jgi:hypothetical protein
MQRRRFRRQFTSKNLGFISVEGFFGKKSRCGEDIHNPFTQKIANNNNQNSECNMPKNC